MSRGRASSERARLLGSSLLRRLPNGRSGASYGRTECTTQDVNDTTILPSSVAGSRPVRGPLSDRHSEGRALVAFGLLYECDVDREADRRGIRIGERVDSAGKKVSKLLFEEDANVRGIQEAVHLVKAIAATRIGDDEINQNDAAFPAAYAQHLADRSLRVSEVMKRTSAEDDIEGFVEEWQRLGVRLLQQNVADARVDSRCPPTRSNASSDGSIVPFQSTDLTCDHVSMETWRTRIVDWLDRRRGERYDRARRAGSGTSDRRLKRPSANSKPGLQHAAELADVRSRRVCAGGGI